MAEVKKSSDSPRIMWGEGGGGVVIEREASQDGFPLLLFV